MKWDNYREIYWTFELSVNQTKILNFYGRETFKEFPASLPDNIKSQWDNNKVFLLEMFEKAYSLIENQSIDEASKNLEFECDINLGNPEILMNQMAIYKSLIELNMKKDENINFQRLFYSQELVMMIAHLEAFLSDSLRAICKVKPEILKSNRKVDTTTIIDSKNRDELIEFLIENYIYDFGWKTLKDKIFFLKDRIGLNVEIPDSELSMLWEAENIRNIVVHNGGRVSQEYINRIEKKGLNVGELIPITSDLMEEVSHIIPLIGWDIFAQTSNKFFGVDELKLIWRDRNRIS